MTDTQFWIIFIAICAAIWMLERIEKRLVDIYRLLKFGKDAD